MYLSRLFLNPCSSQVRNELADPYEMHRTICRAFPKANFKENKPSGILFRVDKHPKTCILTLLVQSQISPDWSFLPAEKMGYLLDHAFLPPNVDRNPDWKEMNMQLRTGQALAFRLRANPTFKKTIERDGGEKHKMRLGIFKVEDQHRWLERKLESAGAALVSVNTTNSQMTRGKLFTRQPEERQMRFLSVQFDGLLNVRDSDKLLAALQGGIGSGKGLGFGLLSLAPIRG